MVNDGAFWEERIVSRSGTVTRFDDKMVGVGLLEALGALVVVVAVDVGVVFVFAGILSSPLESGRDVGVDDLIDQYECRRWDEE